MPRLDLNRLTPVPGSFVDPQLGWRHCDRLFTCALAGDPEREAFLYVLIEHQSSPDKLMPFRVLRYLVRIWDRYLDEHPGAKLLPAIIPLVAYHDEGRWTGPTQLRELIDLDPDTVKIADDYLPRLGFLLDDLTQVGEQGLRARPLTPSARMLLWLLTTAAGNPQLAVDLSRWGDQIQAVLHQPHGGGGDDLTALVTSIWHVSEVPVEQLRDLFTQLGPSAQEVYMTTAETLRREGEERGIAKGRAEGEARGEARGRAEGLVQLLTLKFGPLPPETVDLVHTASIDQIETWTTRVLTADTLHQVLP